MQKWEDAYMHIIIIIGTIISIMVSAKEHDLAKQSSFWDMIRDEMTWKLPRSRTMCVYSFL